MNVRSVAAVALGLTGVAAATLLTGGVYAAGTIEVTDTSALSVGSVDIETSQDCSANLAITKGLARFDTQAQTFLVRDLDVAGTGSPQCQGLTLSIVGVDDSGVPVTDGAVVVSGGSITVPLSNAIGADSVARWHVVLQEDGGYAGAGTTAPSISPSDVTVMDGPVEPLPSPEPTPEAPATSEPTPTFEPEPTPTSDSSLPVAPEPEATPEPTPDTSLNEPTPEVSPAGV